MTMSPMDIANPAGGFNRLQRLKRPRDAVGYTWWLTETEEDKYPPQVLHSPRSKSLAAMQRTFQTPYYLSCLIDDVIETLVNLPNVNEAHIYAESLGAVKYLEQVTKTLCIC